MARKHRHRHEAGIGDEDFIPSNDAERRAHADALRQRAEHDPDPDERAGLLSEAAEYYAILGEDDLAEQLFRRALDEDGAPVGAVHGYYAGFLLGHDRADEALDLIDQARKLRPDDPDVFTIIGETLLEHGRPADAAKWFTTGLVRTFGALAEIEIGDLEFDVDLAILIRGRHEARRALDLPADHLDELFERYRAEHHPAEP